MMIVLAGMRMGTNKMRIQCLACGTTAELGPASSHRQELGTVERSPSQDAIDTFMSMHHLHERHAHEITKVSLNRADVLAGLCVGGT